MLAHSVVYWHILPVLGFAVVRGQERGLLEGLLGYFRALAFDYDMGARYLSNMESDVL